LYGTVSAFAESPKNETLLAAGTDDGLIQITTDGGHTWKKTDNLAGVPPMTYVYHLLASQHNENVFYVVFNNHKRGDFKPYIFRSSDKGSSWAPIQANLPERGSVYSVAEDHVDPNLLFAGTEFGVHFTTDGGKTWRALKAGLPTVAVRDMAIQKRENDLVLATFGRGFYVLDDYSPLRKVKDAEAKEGMLFPVRDNWLYVENSPLGIRGKGFMGESYYQAANPPVGVSIYYYYKEDLKSKKDKRQDDEGKLAKDMKDVPYPAYESLKAEETEESSYLLFTIQNTRGETVRKLKAPAKKGVSKMVWDFRYPSSNPINLNPVPNDNVFQANDVGQLAAPGEYTVTLSKYVDGVVTNLSGPEKFNARALPGSTLPADRPALQAWQREAAELQRSMQAASAIVRDATNRARHLKEAILSVSQPNQEFVKDARSLELKLASIQDKLFGDRTADRLNLDRPPSISNRLYGAIYAGYGSTSDPTTTMKDQLSIATEEYQAVQAELKSVVESDLRALEQKLEAAGAPYTPGRFPDLKKKDN
jgi:hypothetical protein